jgi:hypothetical protein
VTNKPKQQQTTPPALDMYKLKLLRIALCAALFGVFTASNAQVGSQRFNPIQVGSLSINAGAGFGVPYNGSIGVPFGVKASANWGVAELGRGVITIGFASGGSFSHGSWESASENTSRIFFLARGAWHYGWSVPGLDFYGGLSSGFGFDRFHYGDPVDNTTRSVHLFAGIFAGASYYLTPGFGFNVEAGDDITILQLGIIAKIR